MAVETAEEIRDLNPNSPSGTDPVSEGDDHIRLIKKVLKNTLSELPGPKVAIKIPDYESRPGANWATVSDTIEVPNITSGAQAIIIDVSFVSGTSGYGQIEGMWMRIASPDGDAISSEARIIGWDSYHNNPDGKPRSAAASVVFRSILTPAELDGEFKIQVKENTTETSAGIYMLNATVVVTEQL